MFERIKNIGCGLGLLAILFIPGSFILLLVGMFIWRLLTEKE
jgi:hypothetical protein